MSRTYRSKYMVPMLLLVAIAAMEFLVRSTLRSDGGNDFATPYISTVRFLRGANPYSHANFVAEWHAAGAPLDRSVILAGEYSIYPPITLMAFTPLAFLSWPVAFLFFRLISIALFVGLVYCLACKIGHNWRSIKRLGFVAFALALTSVHAGIHQGNPSVPAFTLCALAILSLEEGYEVLAGVLLTLGFCLKPTTAPAAAMIMLFFERKKALSVFVLSVISLGGVAFGIMSRFDPAWKLDYQRNLEFMFGPLGGASFITESEGRFDLLNLQVPLYTILHDPRSANLAAWGISGVLALVWLRRFYFKLSSQQRFDWLAVASLSLIGLLPMYQRNYNIGVILFALFWAVANLHLRAAKAVLWLCGFFLFPGEALLRKLQIGPRLEHNIAWNFIVMSQATWAILAIILVLFYAQSVYRKGTSTAGVKPVLQGAPD